MSLKSALTTGVTAQTHRRGHPYGNAICGAESWALTNRRAADQMRVAGAAIGRFVRLTCLYWPNISYVRLPGANRGQSSEHAR